jgi:hypothetical protein
MASPFQQRARQRKFLYAGLILVLFTASWVWRRYAVEVQATDLALREGSRGEVELSGSLVRLSLTGSRGLATCILWNSAIERQKKNQWNELELLVRSLTKLQPYFITPWHFQSWNLAYNVSVMSDKISDKFFYITRGIELEAEGERQNRDNPDMRFWVGFYTQNKIGQSDETNVMRSLFQLSTIPPNERDPGRFRTVVDGKTVFNWDEFEKFCEQHPQLVRRLREGVRRESKGENLRQFTCESADRVVDFLADNWRGPSMYEEAALTPAGEAWEPKPDKLRPVFDRFPMLPPPRTPEPPQHLFAANELTYLSPLGDDVDPFTIARAWYGYAQEPIPDPDRLPGSTKDFEDRLRQRRPKHMTTLLFRNQPARAQSHVAERLQQEGWFDDTGWPIRDWFRDRDNKFQYGKPGERPAVVGRRARNKDEKDSPVIVEGAVAAWTAAYDRWDEHGKFNHLLYESEAKGVNLEKQAEEFADSQTPKLPKGAPPPLKQRDRMTAEELELYDAYRFVWEYNFYRNLSNFASHYKRADVERKAPTQQARKTFYDAESLRVFEAANSRSMEKYLLPEGLKLWRQVLLSDKEFRDADLIQEQTFEYYWKFLNLYRDEYGKTKERQLEEQVARLVLANVRSATPCGACPAGLLGALAILKDDRFAPLDQGFRALFLLTDDRGEPLMTEQTVRAFLERKNLAPAKQPPSGVPGGPAPEPRP